mgnify:CR=1 FL=1
MVVLLMWKWVSEKNSECQVGACRRTIKLPPYSLRAVTSGHLHRRALTHFRSGTHVLAPVEAARSALQIEGKCLLASSLPTVTFCNLLSLSVCCRIQMLDTIRYMIVWFPVIFMVISLLAKMFPHHHVTRHVAVAAQGRLGQPPGPMGARPGYHDAYRGNVPPPMPLDTVDVGAIAAGAR